MFKEICMSIKSRKYRIIVYSGHMNKSILINHIYIEYKHAV